MADVTGVNVQSVSRALDILKCFDGQDAAMGISKISDRMRLSKSTVYGLVNTLVTGEFLEQDDQTKQYRLGIKLFELGNLVYKRMDLRNEAIQYCQKLVELHAATVHLAVHYDTEIVYVEKFEVPGAIVEYSQKGKRAPMHCTGVGKAIMAFLDEKEFNDYLNKENFVKFTDCTITDPDKLVEEAQRIRVCGYAVDDEEIETGLRCVAAPIFNAQKKAIAAISISASTARLPINNIDRVAKDVKDYAQWISQRMGYKL